MHDRVGLLSFADVHSQVLNWSDPKPWKRTKSFHDLEPGSEDLHDLMGWRVSGPWPPGRAP